MTEVKDQLAEALRYAQKHIHNCNLIDSALAAYEADKARTSVNADGLVAALEEIRDFRWSDERVNVLRHIAREALAEHQKGGK